MFRRGPFVLPMLLLLLACSHAPPQLVQVFSQVNRVFDLTKGTWTDQLSVFVQASSSDGTKVFDRLHLIHDVQDLYVSLSRPDWASIERPGETWFGANRISFPDGRVPTGEWRALLVTRTGQKVEARFQVPPSAFDAPGARQAPVHLQQDPAAPGRFTVTGWVSDYVVWCRDAKGTVVTKLKIFGPAFQVPAGIDSFVLYSYDRARGTGLEVGPFSLKAVAQSADS